MGISRRFRNYLSQKWNNLTRNWKPFVENPLPATEMDVIMRQASIPSSDFFFMLMLSTAIATLGLLSNSAPAIIGAMIIAPMMSPIMSLSYGIIIFEWNLVRRSLLMVFTGVILVILFAFISTELLGLRITSSEILSRTAPTLLDLGVAAAAGAAGAFAYTRRNIMNSIAGVAISVALVPPLAVTGIGLALRKRAAGDVGLSLTEIGLYSGGTDIASGAFILFLTNLLGIVIIAGIVLLTQGYGQWKKSFIGLFIVIALSGLLMQPLGESLHKLYVKSRVLRLLMELPQQYPDIFNGVGWLDSLNVTYRGDLLYVDVEGFTPRGIHKDMQKSLDLATDTFQQYLSDSLGDPVHVDIELIPVDIIHSSSGPDVKKGE